MNAKAVLAYSALNSRHAAVREWLHESGVISTCIVSGFVRHLRVDSVMCGCVCVEHARVKMLWVWLVHRQ